MIKKLNILAIIPARGGSKSLPGKNTKLLDGKPLIAYTIEEAKKSKYISRLILSTDSPEIAKAASQFGIENPFMRPVHLATDTALATDNYEYTLKRMRDEFNYNADVLVILQPTSPLRTAEDIDQAIKIFLEKKADSVISVCGLPFPIERVRTITERGTIKNYLRKEIVLRNREEYKKFYAPNGAILVLDAKLFLKDKTYYWENTYPHIMPEERSLDIDTQHQFDIAEFLMRKRNKLI